MIAARPLVLALLVIAATPARAQEAPAQQTIDRTLNLFLDCDECDDDYVRREIAYVNYVRDRERADVHVLVTDEQTGGGGQRFTFHLIGQGPFDEEDHTLSFSLPPSDTEDEERKGIVRALKLGLVPYLLRTPLSHRMAVQVSGDVESAGEAEKDDPWNGWTIELYGDGYADVEASQYAVHLRYGVYVDRVTERWKIRIRPYFNYNVDEFEDDGETIRSESRRDGLDSYAIRSIDQHWSIGAFGDVFSSTYNNVELRLRGGPAVEYSVFPYDEASRRELTFAYNTAISRATYIDTTIFGELSQVLAQHILDVNYDVQQTWGSIDVRLAGAQYLHDLNKYNVELDGGVSIRLVRGLSLRLSGEFGLIHDQLSLARGDASLEEVLLRRRQLATDFQFEGSIGFRYRFGSIYNNVVNTRF